jgi:hypothetical protein
VNDAAVADGLRRRGQRLADDLATEDRAPAEILATTAEQIAIEALEAQQRYQVGEDALHWTARSMARGVMGRGGDSSAERAEDELAPHLAALDEGVGVLQAGHRQLVCAPSRGHARSRLPQVIRFFAYLSCACA